jgi:hypothetical protein
MHQNTQKVHMNVDPEKPVYQLTGPFLSFFRGEGGIMEPCWQYGTPVSCLCIMQKPK